MSKTIQGATCADIIAQIHTAVSKSDLSEAYELILLLENENSSVMNDVDEMKFTMLKGLVMLKRGDYKVAEESFLTSLKLAKGFADTRLLCNRYDNLVALYTITNQIHQAIEYLKISMELKESAGDEAAHARSLIQMSSLLFAIVDYEDGRGVLQKAEAIIDKLDNSELKLVCHFAYGTLLCHDEKYSEALQRFDQVILYAQETNDILHITRAYYNQGYILMKLEQWQEAEKVYTKLLHISRENHFTIQELLTNIQLAWIALKKNDLKRCRELYEYVNHQEALEEDEGLKENLTELAAKLYEAEGDPHNALKAYHNYMKYYKVHYDNEQSKVVLFIKARYESEKRERELQEVKLSRMESEIKALSAEHELRKSEKRFKAWIENGTEMIVILNDALQPIYSSPFIFRTFGYDQNEFNRLDMYDMIHPEDLANVRETLHIAHQSPGIAINTQFRFPQKDGQYRWLESTCTNLLMDESVYGIVCNLKDITERKQSEHAIHELNKSLEAKITERTSELQEAINDLESFSYSVSHDLRSPLRIITGYTKLLIADHEADLNNEGKEFIHTILDNSVRMNQLIDDLLHFSKMGRKSLYKSPVDVYHLVSNIISELRKGGDSITKNITLHKLSPAYCDQALIKQVWINLLSNAIKYSAKKTNPIIEIGSVSGQKEITYYIKDNGAGFDMKFSKNLFTVFKRLHDRADFDGTGVGLALSNRIIKMHEGRMWAEAEVGKGATFYFVLPQEEATDLL